MPENEIGPQIKGQDAVKVVFMGLDITKKATIIQILYALLVIGFFFFILPYSLIFLLAFIIISKRKELDFGMIIKKLSRCRVLILVCCPMIFCVIFYMYVLIH